MKDGWVVGSRMRCWLILPERVGNGKLSACNSFNGRPDTGQASVYMNSIKRCPYIQKSCKPLLFPADRAGKAEELGVLPHRHYLAGLGAEDQG